MKNIKKILLELKKIVFIYICVYIICSVFNFLIEPIIFWIDSKTLTLLVNTNNEITGSGDNFYQYVKFFIVSALSLFLWFFHRFIFSLDERHFYWIILVVRIYLIYYLSFYGIIKLFGNQFPFPSLLRLTQPIGDLSPMGLAWTFMGYSKFYISFTGFTELIGGVLLINKKTVLLGCLILISIMSNVFVMNLVYDIPVKLFSFHLLFMLLALASLDLKRLYNFFISNENITSKNLYSPIKDIETYKKVGIFLKFLFVIILILFVSLKIFFVTFNDSKKLPIYGIYEVNSVVKNNDSIPLSLKDEELWRYIIFEKNGYASIRFVNNKSKTFVIKYDDSSNFLFLENKKLTFSNKFKFKFNENKNLLFITGVFNKYSLKMEFAKKNLEDFNLINTEFRWISDSPRNN
jgi:hypothetical protein